MAGIGANGSVTTYPAHGEKMCAGCEFWTGAREVTYSGSCATTRDGQPALCEKQNKKTFPNQACTCCPNQFTKWRRIK